MLGLLGALAFGAVAYGAWASSKNRDSNYHSHAAKAGMNYYIDDKGIKRHMNGRKFTPEEFIKNDQIDRRLQLRKSYNDFVDKWKIDKEWYSFEDFIMRRFKNNHTTGKALFPEIDWDNVPTDEKQLKPFNKPPIYLYRVWNEKGSGIKYRIFKDGKAATEYGIKTYGYNKNNGQPWNTPDLIDEKYVYAGVDELGIPVTYIMDDTGEIFENKKGGCLPWELEKK